MIEINDETFGLMINVKKNFYHRYTYYFKSPNKGKKSIKNLDNLI